jgi:septal ring-binding cell division protein DamX
VFFGLGYGLGKSVSSVPDPLAQHMPSAAASVGGGPKPSAAKPAAQPPCDATTTTNCTPAPKSDSDELAFVTSGEKPTTTPTTTDTQALPTEAQAAAAAAAATNPASTTPGATAPELTKPASPAFVVQVAAVTRKEDADALQTALKKKNYPVFVVADSSDHLFHVQVGPFSNRNDASSTRDKLTGDGYPAILK